MNDEDRIWLPLPDDEDDGVFSVSRDEYAEFAAGHIVTDHRAGQLDDADWSGRNGR